MKIKKKTSFSSVTQTFTNKIIDKKELKKLIAWAFSTYGSGRTSYMSDKLKELGFHYATKAGISISIEDLRVPPSKRELINATDKEIRITAQRYKRGEITIVERFQKVIDTWNSASESLKDEVIRYFKETDPLNPVYIMAFSGARGNISQVKQLVGMRGLMSDPQGQIIDLPIKSNFREGLTVTEYVISCYGARKGLVDTALRTADSGYLTRRLVDVAQEIIVREVDCKTKRGIMLRNMMEKTKTLIPLENRLVGRSAFETLYTPDTSDILIHINQDLNASDAKDIIKSKITSVYVRSPLTCESLRSVCQFCYGWDLAYGSLVDLGEAIGIIAAQSIGEPGTQLTMRTFHTGGVFTGELAEQIKAPFDGIAQLPDLLQAKLIRTRHGNEAILIEQNTEIDLYDFTSKKSKLGLMQGSTVFLNENQEFKNMQVIGEIFTKTNVITEKVTRDLVTTHSGEVYFPNLPAKKKTNKQLNKTLMRLKSSLIWILEGDVYTIPASSHLMVAKGHVLQTNDVIASKEITTDYGGVVKLNDQVPNDIGVTIASTCIQDAFISINKDPSTSDYPYVLEFKNEKQFLLHCFPGNKISNGQIIGELIDNSYSTVTGGFAKYMNVNSTPTNKESSQDIMIYWVSEEIHEINKDLALLLIPDGTIVGKNEEIIKGIYSVNEGFLSVREEDEIIKEITIKPGYLQEVDRFFPSFDPRFFERGEEIWEDIKYDSTTFVELIRKNEHKFLLIRPVTKYLVSQNHTYLQQDILPNLKATIRVSIIQKPLVKDCQRVIALGPIHVLKTYLVLDIISDLPNLSADVEFFTKDPTSKSQLKFALTENLTLKQDTFGELSEQRILARLLVKNGETLKAGRKVAETKLLCKTGGEVHSISVNSKNVKSILVLTSSHKQLVATNGKTLQVSKGDLIQYGDHITESLRSPKSGQITDVQYNTITIRFGSPYLISPGSIVQVKHSDLIQSGDTLAILIFEQPKTGDIIQGLPRVEEILEARIPKEPCELAQSYGKIELYTDEDNNTIAKIIDDKTSMNEHTIQISPKSIISRGDSIFLADPLTEGPPNPHEILCIFFNFYKNMFSLYEAAKLSLQKVQMYLVNEIQSVYQSQNVDISDKHIEIIVRQMTSKVRIETGGDTSLLPGELIGLQLIETINNVIIETKGLPAIYSPTILGITKASLNTDSFISAASFQETTRILTEAAIEGKTDWLRGLKENVIIGRLIPAGTGFKSYSESFDKPSLEKKPQP
nr:RNA polymerase beta'' subunit [Cryptomonas borealis]